MRTLPPLVVSTIAVAVIFIAAILVISGQAEMRAEASKGTERQELEISKTEQRPVTTTVTYEEKGVVPYETLESEAETSSEGQRSKDWSAEESAMLLKISMAEAEGESAEGKALVMLVVLNRVWDEDFPDTIEEVIFQPGQFSTTTDGGRYYTTEPDEGCYEALELVESGWDESGGALYFESCTGGSWHSSHLNFLYEVGNHRFYK